jgi:hypothetical protein
MFIPANLTHKVIALEQPLAIVKPETVVKWYRAGFRLYWRWKSKVRGGRPTVPLEICKLIPPDEHCRAPLAKWIC